MTYLFLQVLALDELVNGGEKRNETCGGGVVAEKRYLKLVVVVNTRQGFLKERSPQHPTSEGIRSGTSSRFVTQCKTAPLLGSLRELPVFGPTSAGSKVKVV